MYIRRTSIKSRKDGRQYYTYRLVESERTEKGVRQRTLLNLGTDFSLPREKWPEVASRVQQIIRVRHCCLNCLKKSKKWPRILRPGLFRQGFRTKLKMTSRIIGKWMWIAWKCSGRAAFLANMLPWRAFDSLKLGEHLKTLGVQWPAACRSNRNHYWTDVSTGK